MQKKLNQRGQFSFVFVLLIIFVSLLVIFAVVSPLMANLSTSMYAGSQPLIQDTKNKIGLIDDANIRNTLLDGVQAQQDYQGLNIQALTALATYGGLIIIGIVVLVFFLLARRNVEAGSIG